MTQSRHLAAIMFVDIVGYTAMMQRDEQATLTLRNKLKDALEQELSSHGGHIVQFYGDGALCSFDSATNSVKAAMAIQLRMREVPKVPLRVGIHQADVVFQGNEVIGDGVNIASRLESLAIPGSIFISSKVYDDIKNHSEIQSISLGKYVLKNVTEPVDIYSISNPGLEVPKKAKLEGKGIKYVSDKVTFRKKSLLLRALIIAAILAIAGWLVIPDLLNKQRARNELLPAIQTLVEENFRAPTEAYLMGLEAEKYIPEDSTLNSLWPIISSTVAMITEPQGAEVFWKDYDAVDDDWTSLGQTPIVDARLPRGYLRMEIRKEGYQTIEYAGPVFGRIGSEIDTLVMEPESSDIVRMARIPKKRARMYIVGLEQESGKQVSEFLIDKYEVTNKQFKEFVDAGGYSTTDYWEYPIISDGQEISLEEALPAFIDKTGRPGPASWEVGTYPNGMGDHPVTGVSWYEAAAYTSFAGKQLPTIFHWGAVAQTARTAFIVPLSNFNGNSTEPVGKMKGYNSFGIYDLAGNAREWCYNESDRKGQRYILGGGYNDATYAFNDSYTQSSMDRSVTNGFRCIEQLEGDTNMAKLKVVVPSLFRDYKKEEPVDDKTFALYLNQFNYDKKPLDPKVEEVLERDFWNVERVTYDAGYNNERMQAWVYTPKDIAPPFQPVIYFPGSGDIYSKKFNPDRITGRIDFILKSGRALILPIYKGTHERHSDLKSDLQEETVLYKDHVVSWGKEMGRTIDYLETRTDMQADKLGYLGWSWGGFMGGIIPAVEKRFKAVVLHVGGMEMNPALPEVDQINYLPRVTQPVLMLNGKHDMFFPVETSQRPMFDFLGTPDKDKKIIIYEVGHLVPRADFINESLGWFDKYLGPAN